MSIRVVLPYHLRGLAGVDEELRVELPGPPTLGALLDAIEQSHPALRGTIRDYASGQRRPFIRFFACQSDLSHEPWETVLPPSVTSGAEPLMIVGAMAGG